MTNLEIQQSLCEKAYTICEGYGENIVDFVGSESLNESIIATAGKAIWNAVKAIFKFIIGFFENAIKYISDFLENISKKQEAVPQEPEPEDGTDKKKKKRKKLNESCGDAEIDAFVDEVLNESLFSHKSDDDKRLTTRADEKEIKKRVKADQKDAKRYGDNMQSSDYTAEHMSKYNREHGPKHSPYEVYGIDNERNKDEHGERIDATERQTSWIKGSDMKILLDRQSLMYKRAEHIPCILKRPSRATEYANCIEKHQNLYLLIISAYSAGESNRTGKRDSRLKDIDELKENEERLLGDEGPKTGDETIDKNNFMWIKASKSCFEILNKTFKRMFNKHIAFEARCAYIKSKNTLNNDVSQRKPTYTGTVIEAVNRIAGGTGAGTNAKISGASNNRKDGDYSARENSGSYAEDCRMYKEWFNTQKKIVDISKSFISTFMVNAANSGSKSIGDELRKPNR